MACFIPEPDSDARKPQYDERMYVKSLDLLMLWQKRLVYRNPDQWLTWLYYNQESNALKVMAINLDNDEEFVNFVTEQADLVSDPNVRQWWQELMKY